MSWFPSLFVSLPHLDHHLLWSSGCETDGRSFQLESLAMCCRQRTRRMSVAQARTGRGGMRPLWSRAGDETDPMQPAISEDFPVGIGKLWTEDLLVVEKVEGLLVVIHVCDWWGALGSVVVFQVVDCLAGSVVPSDVLIVESGLRFRLDSRLPRFQPSCLEPRRQSHLRDQDCPSSKDEVTGLVLNPRSHSPAFLPPLSGSQCSCRGSEGQLLFQVERIYQGCWGLRLGIDKTDWWH